MKHPPAPFLSLWILVASLIAADDSQAQTFEDASDQLITNDLEFGVGASIVDVNADGRPDIYRRNSLYIQEEDGRFRNLHPEMGFNQLSGGGFGAVFGDINNDGFVEAFQIDLDPSLPFYLNRAGLRFVEHSNDSGIRDVALVQGTMFLDFDSNGLLDLFVGIDGGTPNLYWNVGLDHFLDRGLQFGFDLRYAYGVAAADYDRDGDPDILLTQCFPPPGDSLRENVLYRNDGSIFTNVRTQAGIVDNLQSWATVWLDYDNDGNLDFYVGNTSNVGRGDFGFNKLYRNNGDATFDDVSVEAGVAHRDSSQSVGVSAADFDNDGWVDLFVTEVANGLASLYRNNGDGTFTDIWEGGSAPAVSSQAVAVGDVNDDGWIDIFQPTFRGDQLLLNEGGGNHYLVIHLRGKTSNHFAVGARLDLYAGGNRQVREITAGDGMTSQNHNLSAHFGLGQAEIVDSLVIRWPGGLIQRLAGIAADRLLTVVEGIGPNQPPDQFSLASPTRKSAVPSDVQTLDFAWSQARDPEDIVSYTMNIVGADVDTTISGINSTSYTVDRSIFSDGVRYRWNVVATDGHSVRAALHADFVFGPTTSNEEAPELPSEVSRFEVYPNPVIGRAAITIDVRTPAEGTLEAFDVTGRRVGQIHTGRFRAGSNRFDWRPVGLAPGLYVIRARVGTVSLNRMLVLR